MYLLFISHFFSLFRFFFNISLLNEHFVWFYIVYIETKHFCRNCSYRSEETKQKKIYLNRKTSNSILRKASKILPILLDFLPFFFKYFFLFLLFKFFTCKIKLLFEFTIRRKILKNFTVQKQNLCSVYLFHSLSRFILIWFNIFYFNFQFDRF